MRGLRAAGQGELGFNVFVLGDDNSRKGKKNAAKVEGRRQEEEELNKVKV